MNTYFYKKIEPQPNYEEVKERVEDTFSNVINYFKDNNENNIYDEAIALNKRKLSVIKKGLCKLAVCNLYDYKGKDTIFDEKFGFMISTNYYNAFKIKDTVKEVVLKNVDETFKYIEENKENIIFKKYWEKTIKKYWGKNPNSLVIIKK